MDDLGLHHDQSQQHALVDLTHALAFKGSMHLTEQMLAHMLKSLQYWEAQRKWTQSLVYYFHSKACRIQFYVEGQLGEKKILFKSGPPIFDSTGREWRTFSQAFAWIDERLPTIVEHWPWKDQDAQSDDEPSAVNTYILDGEEVELDPKQYNVHKKRVTQAISDSFNLNYVTLVRLIAKWVEHVEAWNMSCKCHSDPLIKELFGASWRCPLEGKRVIDCASGDFGPFIDELAEWSHAILLARFSTDLTATGKAAILLEFGLAKSALYTEASLRSWPCLHLPIRLCGIANEDDSVALVIAADCILQWHLLSHHEKRAAHPETQRLMDPSGQFVLELTIALQESKFADLGQVAEWRYKCQFCDSLEISVEGLHAQNQRYANRARHHSEPHVSMNTPRKGEIFAELSTAEGTTKLVQLVEKCSTPASCLHALGLQHHPRSRGCIRGDGLLESNFPHSTAQRIIYQNEELTQFQTLVFDNGTDGGGPGGGPGDDPADAGDDKGSKGGDKGGKGDGGKKDDDKGDDKSDSADSDAGGGGGDKGPKLCKKLLASHMYDHWKSHATRGNVYSIKLPDHQNHFPPLKQLRRHLAPERVNLGIDVSTFSVEELQLPHVALALQYLQAADAKCESDTGMQAESPFDDGDAKDKIFRAQHAFFRTKSVVFFRLVHLNPKAVADQEEVDNSDRQLFTSRHCIVEVLPAVAFQSSSMSALLSATGEVFTVDMKALLADCNSSIFRWRPQPCEHFFCEDFQLIGRSTDHAFLMARQYGALLHKQSEGNDAEDHRLGVNTQEAETKSAMKALHKLGIAELDKEGDGANPFDYWSLSLFGSVAHKPTLLATESTNMKAVPYETENVVKMSPVDCLINLMNASWTPKVFPSKEGLKKGQVLETKGSKTPRYLF